MSLGTKDTLELFHERTVRLDIVDLFATYLELNALRVEGLFRVPGEQAGVKHLLQRVARNDHIDEVVLKDYDVHTIASALKLYITVAHDTEGILPHSFYAAHEAHQDEDARLRALLAAFQDVKPENQPILRRVWRLLGEVVRFSDVNQMGESNLGMVFSPTLLSIGTVDHVTSASAILTLLVEHRDRVLAALPEGESSYRIFGGTEPMSAEDWKKFLANASVRRFNTGDVALEDDTENKSLFIVKTGTFTVEKGTLQLATLSPGELFGEMSFLGRYRTSASVVAAVNGAEVFCLSVQVMTQLFAINPELSEKFYWNLAAKLARRLQNLPKKTVNISNLLKSGEIPVEDEKCFISVWVAKDSSDGNMSSFTEHTLSYTPGQLLRDLRKREDPHANVQYSFSSIQKQDECKMWVTQAAQQYDTDTSYRLCVSKAKPVEDTRKFTLSEHLIIRDFPCRFGKPGTLFITDVAVAHCSKSFGFEKMRVRWLKNIISIRVDDRVMTMKCTNKKPSVSEQLQFEEAAHANMAKSAIESLLEESNEQQAASRPNRVRQETRLANKEGFCVRVLADYNARSSTGLSLVKGDQVVVLKKLNKDWVLGQANGKMGKFPLAVVDILMEPSMYLKDAGYIHLKDLPDRRDWKLLLAGAQRMKFSTGDVVLEQGDPHQRLYQIDHGACKVVQKTVNAETGEAVVKTLGLMGVNDTFGEVSFLLGGAATASVVAATDDVEVCAISAEYMKRLFRKDLSTLRPGLSARVFKYLASVLEGRLRIREGTVVRTAETSEPAMGGVRHRLKQALEKSDSGYQLAGEKGELVLVLESQYEHGQALCELNDKIGYIPLVALEPVE